MQKIIMFENAGKHFLKSYLKHGRSLQNGTGRVLGAAANASEVLVVMTAVPARSRASNEGGEGGAHLRIFCVDVGALVEELADLGDVTVPAGIPQRLIQRLILLPPHAKITRPAGASEARTLHWRVTALRLRAPP